MVCLHRVFRSSVIAPLEGIVDTDHAVSHHAANGLAVARASRGGRCLAEPADSVAGAGCANRRRESPIARELHVMISNVTIADQASRTSAGVPSGRREPRYLLTQLARHGRP